MVRGFYYRQDSTFIHVALKNTVLEFCTESNFDSKQFAQYLATMIVLHCGQPLALASEVKVNKSLIKGSFDFDRQYWLLTSVLNDKFMIYFVGIFRGNLLFLCCKYKNPMPNTNIQTNDNRLLQLFR